MLTGSSQTIFLPIFALCLVMFVIGIIFWKRVCRSRRPTVPYNKPQIALITPTYQQHRLYQQQQQQCSYQQQQCPYQQQQYLYQPASSLPPVEQQSQFYQPTWSRSTVEQAPPSYYTAMNHPMISPSMSYVRQ